MDAVTHHSYMHNWEGTATTMVNNNKRVDVKQQIMTEMGTFTHTTLAHD